MKRFAIISLAGLVALLGDGAVGAIPAGAATKDSIQRHR